MSLRQHEFRIGVDLMGAESPPEMLLQAAESTLSFIPKNSKIIGIGSPYLASMTKLPFVNASETIEMEDNPLIAIRRKPDSSLCVGLRMLKEGEIDAFVSAGNTGALVFGSKKILSMQSGVLRPALCALMPTKKGPLAVLDVGANVQCRAIHLIQFAFIGAAYQQARGVKHPSVGLLNIGIEALKGTSELRLAYKKLMALSSQPKSLFRFVGNVEGKNVFEGEIDVLITDGFSGNVFLKTAEGIASLILDRVSEKFSSQIVEQVGTELSDLRRHLHYAEYPGALLCGVKGVVIKCHGYSSPQAFANGILAAVRLVEEGFLQILQNQMLSYSFSR